MIALIERSTSLPDPLLSAVSEMADDEIIRAAREAFARAADAEPENRRNALDDMRFVGLDDLWPAPKRLKPKIG